jgi:DNA-binding MarR family transcriptional regulator
MAGGARHKKEAAGSTGLVFIRAYNKWHTTIKRELRQLGITHPQFVVMTVLEHLGESGAYVTQAGIARTADMDVMSVSQIVRGLEAKGYLARSSNPGDSRANALRLLPKGIEAVRAALPIVEGIDDAFFGALGSDEAAFRAALGRLTEECGTQPG